MVDDGELMNVAYFRTLKTSKIEVQKMFTTGGSRKVGQQQGCVP